jgi:hypothetical protein
MKLPGLAVLAAGLLLCGCAIDGGSSGTGITTAEGNVVSVLSAAAATSPMPLDVPLDGSLGGIRVSVEGTDIAGETDPSGAFRVRGDYDSVVTLLFARAQDALAARLEVNVPAGGTLTLVDVALDAASGTARPESQGVDFDGTIVAVDCAAGELQLVSQQRPDDGDHYVVLLAGSTVVDAMGAVVPCDRLTPGEDAHVGGVVEPDGSFGNARVVLD